MNVVTNVLILPLQFFLNKVSYVHQLEKKLMNSNNKVTDQESKWEKFQLFCVVVRIRMQKKLISYFILVIVPKQSLCQPLFMYSRKCILCTCSSILLVKMY